MAISLQPDHLQAMFLYQNGVAFNIQYNGTIFGNVDHQLETCQSSTNVQYWTNIGQMLKIQHYHCNQTTYRKLVLVSKCLSHYILGAKF